MMSRIFPAIIAELGLILFLTSQVLAQAPITGWDKVKFGMSPEELQQAYKEEEEFHKDAYYEEMWYIETYYAGQPEQLALRKSEYKEFWYEREECWSRKEGGIGYPRRLSASWTVLQEQTWLVFRFVGDRLFNIEIELGTKSYLPVGFSMEKQVTESHELGLKLAKLTSTLTKKYGKPSDKKQIEEETTRQAMSNMVPKKETVLPRSSPWQSLRSMSVEIQIPAIAIREILTWTDLNGNTIELTSYSSRFRYQEQDYDLLYHAVISYFDKELTELWEQRQKQWKNEVAHHKDKERALTEKGTESF